ncbi:hypothetical protein [Sorangium sp. So ce1389]|uniref:hypothetical protein n=1 Tax=Sorangium sp. So ce1389 TaxID=3133336 RepID=UPI003F62C812
MNAVLGTGPGRMVSDACGSTMVLVCVTHMPPGWWMVNPVQEIGALTRVDPFR